MKRQFPYFNDSDVGYIDEEFLETEIKTPIMSIKKESEEIIPNEQEPEKIS